MTMPETSAGYFAVPNADDAWDREFREERRCSPGLHWWEYWWEKVFFGLGTMRYRICQKCNLKQVRS